MFSKDWKILSIKSLIFVRSTGKIFSKILTWKSSVSDKTLTTVPDICESIICLWFLLEWAWSFNWLVLKGVTQ